MKKFILGNRVITEFTEPYIIAEIGVNHEGSMEKAKELIRLAKEGGADAAKFQTYKAKGLAIKNSPAYWDTSKEPTKSQFELFKKYDAFEKEDYIELANYCKEIGIDFLSTPFDHSAVEFLADLMPFFKIASADITNTPLLRKVASYGKPIVLSTGASTIAEAESAVAELEHSGIARDQITLLHCVLNYPTPNENAHLNMISGLKERFPDLVIGYSDHTMPDPTMLNLTAAFLKGALVIEKHFTHDKTLPGNDHYHAMDVDDLKQFKKNLATLICVGGEKEKKPIDDEAISRSNARRSVVTSRELKQGEKLTEDMLICKRPQHGICPTNWDKLLGATLLNDVAEDQPLQWSDLELVSQGDE